MACNPDFFVVRIDEFRGISVDRFRFAASIRTLDRKFHVDSSMASKEESATREKEREQLQFFVIFRLPIFVFGLSGSKFPVIRQTNGLRPRVSTYMLFVVLVDVSQIFDNFFIGEIFERLLPSKC